MKNLEFNAQVEKFQNGSNDTTKITLTALGKDVNLNQLHAMKETSTVHVVISSNQLELLDEKDTANSEGD